MPPSQQTLDPDHPAAAQVNDGLEEQLELPAIERDVQIGLETDRTHHRTTQPWRVLNSERALLLLGNRQGDIGFAQRLLRALQPGVDARKSNARGDPDAVPAKRKGLLVRVLQSGCD